MSLLGEKTLILQLPDLGSIEFLAREGLHLDVIPTESLRPVYTWAMDYYTASGKAPSVEVIKERWGPLLADHELDIDVEPEESVEWAIDDLKSAYVRNVAGSFSRRLATDTTAAGPEDGVEILMAKAAELSALALDLQPRTSAVDMRASADRILTDYDAAAASQGVIEGLAIGLDQVDQYIGGIHPGEMAVFAAPAKMGKSWFLDRIALKHWEGGGLPALFTLENSIEMTEMRIACMATNVSIMEMQRGTLSDEDYERLRWWVNDVLRVADNPLRIFNPETVNRNPHAVVQATRASGCDSIVLDQLTFMETSRSKRDQSRAYELSDIMRDLRGLVGTGRRPLPLAAAHQIKREGIKQAEKTGRLQMTDMADSSEVERAVDFAFGLYASEDDRAVNRMQLQGLAARRVPTETFDLLWNIEVGLVACRGVVSLED